MIKEISSNDKITTIKIVDKNGNILLLLSSYELVGYVDTNNITIKKSYNKYGEQTIELGVNGNAKI